MLCTRSRPAWARPPAAGGERPLVLPQGRENNPAMMSSTPPDASAGPSTLPGAWASSRPPARSSPPVQKDAAGHPQRKPQAGTLTPQAHAWLSQLPPRYQPLATARRHPHIINRLCELWAQPAELPIHLRELMLSNRPGRRKGFAFEVLTELADLQSLVGEMQQGK
jgi:hypothetical protein